MKQNTRYINLASAMCVLCAVASVLAAAPGLLATLPQLKQALYDQSPVTAFFLSAVFGFGACWLLYPLAKKRFEKLVAQSHGPLLELDKAASPRAILMSIAVLAAASLFLELVLIRWQASLFPVFALYKNFALLACFCGLGIGYAQSRQAPLLLPAVLPVLAFTMLLLTSLYYSSTGFSNALRYIALVQEESSVFTMQRPPGLQSWLVYDFPVYLLLITTFILNTLIMLPVTQYCGHLMQRAGALKAYGYNLLGSIAGVAALFFLSWLWTGPVVWFSVVAVLLLWYMLPLAAARRVGLCAGLACVIIAGWPVKPLVHNIYSPYQLIQKTVTSEGLMAILSAGSYFQRVHDLSLDNPRRNTAENSKLVGYYELPFRMAPTLNNVVIVGAGSGNDVAAALRAGAKHVDAVEIDPAIQLLGRFNHPEHPYKDPRVSAIVDDGRTFFRNTGATFDTIVYGVLDSHILLSHGSNVRLDSFVYTREGLGEAYSRLAPGGMMSVSFALPSMKMGHKIYRILESLPESGKPLVVSSGYNSHNTHSFMVRKKGALKLPSDFMKSHDLQDKTAVFATGNKEAVDLPTDDWPFFYMDAKMYPATYVAALILVMALAFILVQGLLPGQKWNRSLMPFTFLGGGFMLVETKAITELGLLFGNTWHVIGITIIGVLVMAFIANLLVEKYALRKVALPYVLLLATIAFGYAIAVSGGVAAAGIISKISMVALLTSPLLFSGIVFSVLLRDTDEVAPALAYNLVGAMLGGLLEYNSMQFGFAFLYVLALALYALAWITTRRGKGAG